MNGSFCVHCTYYPNVLDIMRVFIIWNKENMVLKRRYTCKNISRVLSTDI